MSGFTMSDAALRQALAEIDRTQAETRRLLAEQAPERAMPILVMISGMAAGGALVGGTVASKTLLGS